MAINDPIVIVEYQSHWPKEFNEIGALLRKKLGDLALRIDHIGSTAVPGLASKDVIDVQVTVSNLSVRPRIETQLAADFLSRGAGVDHVPFTDRDGGDGWTKLYFREKAGRRTHIHVREMNAPNQRYPLLFRDYLRKSPEAASAYGLIKTRIADLPLTQREQYVSIKDGVCDLIFLAAESRAELDEWFPEPTDA